MRTPRGKSVEAWPFSFVDSVRYGDLDANGHLNNAAFLQFFESARVAYVALLAPDDDPTDPAALGLIFAEAHINYRSPAFYEEQIRTWIRPFALRRSSFRVAFRMVTETDGRLVAEGWGAMVGYDFAASRAIPLWDSLTAALRAAGAVDVDVDVDVDTDGDDGAPGAGPAPTPDTEA